MCGAVSAAVQESNAVAPVNGRRCLTWCQVIQKAAASQLLRDGQLRVLRCTVSHDTKINAQCSSNYPFIDKKGQRPSELQTAGDMSGNVPTRKFLVACFGSRGSLQDSAELPEAGKEDTVTARLHQSRPHLSAGAS